MPQSAFSFKRTAAELNTVITITTLWCLVYKLFKLNHIDYSNFICKKHFFNKQKKEKKIPANNHIQCVAHFYKMPNHEKVSAKEQFGFRTSRCDIKRMGLFQVDLIMQYIHGFQLQSTDWQYLAIQKRNNFITRMLEGQELSS